MNLKEPLSFQIVSYGKHLNISPTVKLQLHVGLDIMQLTSQLQAGATDAKRHLSSASWSEQWHLQLRFYADWNEESNVILKVF